MDFVNSRVKRVFLDRDEAGPAQRSFTFDEATLVAHLVETLVQRNSNSPRQFQVSEALTLVASMTVNIPRPNRYIRPMLEFLQSLVNVGLLVEVTHTAKIGGITNEERVFAAGSTQTLEEWARSSAAISLGLPYAAHVFSDIAVRVHSGVDESSPVASGVVISRDWVLTNAHVVRDADRVCVSWGASTLVEATQVISSKAIDLAILHVPGFDSHPTAWLRRPKSTEPVVILAYPEIPQIASRPLLKFNGWVATDETLTTYFGDHQIIVSAVMGPGASGGPIFGADGCMVGLVVQTLEGKRQAEDGHTMQSTFHAALPADIVLHEVRSLHPDLALVNVWASAEARERMKGVTASTSQARQ